MKHRIVDGPLGTMTLVVTDAGALAGLYLHEQKYHPDAAEFGERNDTVAEDAVQQLAEYFAGRRTSFELALDPHGTEFQRTVWAALREIDYGSTETYGALAQRIGSPRSSRAVGAATGRNPISIIVPCHRLVGASGQLTGYAGGLDRKRWLLEHEAGDVLI